MYNVTEYTMLWGMYNVTGGGIMLQWNIQHHSGIYSITGGCTMLQVGVLYHFTVGSIASQKDIYSISLECTMLQGGIYNVMVLWGCTLQVAVSCYIGKYSITVERTILISFEKWILIGECKEDWDPSCAPGGSVYIDTVLCILLCVPLSVQHGKG